MGVLQDAIRAHERWIDLLALATWNGGDDFQVEHVRADNRCRLGRWLHGEGKAAIGDPVAWELIVDTHARFHAEAAEVLVLARSGHRVEAVQAMEPGTPFSEWSGRLVTTLRDFLD